MKNTQVKIGDYIHGQYKFGCVEGIVIKVLKNHVVIERYSSHYEGKIIYKAITGEVLNVTTSRIYEVIKIN